MDKLLTQTIALIDDLETLHDDQISSFDNELLPNLEAQSEQREKKIDLLGQYVTIILGKSTAESQGEQVYAKPGINEPDNAEATLLACKNRINGILEKNRVLKEKVLFQKKMLKLSMKNVSRGKQVIISYRPYSGSAGSRATVMNLTG
ncbi:MAG: hypothetical protein U9P10_10935 [Thermodesulfobacteriota bacterium]|nr:hypothetical protein [Thermodesulfobacteriota bacterium]